MKNILKKFTWGKTDEKTLKHTVLGMILFALFLVANTFLTPEQSALVSVFVVACVWEYQQHSLKNVQMDVKDIVAGCLVGITVVLIYIF